MKAIYRLLIFAALVAAPTLFAQSYTIDMSSCGHVSNPFYCYGIPATLDGAAQASTTFWLDVPYPTVFGQWVTPGRGFVQFLSGDLAALGKATITQYYATKGTAFPSAVSSITVQFGGSGYTGVVTLNFSYYYSPGGGGKGGGGAGWHFNVVSGNMYVTSSGATASSPIAPTPTSCPKCSDIVLKTPSLGLKGGPIADEYGYSECNGVSPVAGPFYGGNGYWCEVYKGYCPVTQLGNQWQWVYWTDCASM